MTQMTQMEQRMAQMGEERETGLRFGRPRAQYKG